MLVYQSVPYFCAEVDDEHRLLISFYQKTRQHSYPKAIVDVW